MNESGDLLMKFVIGGNAIAGTSNSVLTTGGKIVNPLSKGFEPGYMIEVDSFSFKCGISGTEPGDPPPPAPPKQNPKPDLRHGSVRPGKSAEESSTNKDNHAPKTAGRFKSWRSGKSIKYPLDVQPITFDRLVDATSATLIQNCIDCISYDSATVIKRKPAGSPLAGEVYLRMDFGGVLITGVDWDDDDYVKEKCTFICRSITVSYRAQLPHGGLGPVVSGFWSMVPNEKQLTFT